ncbi:MAG: tyrosine-type recombinase/integrase [Bacillota bacterium]
MSGKHGIFPRGKVLYIRYYDPIQKKAVTESTEFPDTRQGFKDAKKYKEEKVESLKKQKKSLKNRLIPISATLNEAFEHYLRNNTDKDKNTITEYNTFFYNYLTKKFPADAPCTVLTKLSVEDFLIDVKEMKKSQNTKYNICKNMRKFLNFLFEYSYLKNVFIINKDTFTKQEVKEVIVYSKEDIKKIMDGLQEKTSNFRTTIYLLVYSGLRPIDLMYLTGDKIDIEKGIMKFYSKKLDEWRTVPLHSELIPVLKERLAEVGSGKIVDYFELHAVGVAFRIYLAALGLNKKGYTLRTFRKYFETESYELDGDARAIAYIAGHSPQTADRYYRKFKNERLKKEIEKFSLPKQEDNKKNKTKQSEDKKK